MKFTIPNFEAANVLVIGDAMLDRYWHGTSNRISPEAPVPVVHVQESDERPGGATNVALNINAIGSKASFLGICGADAEADTLENKLRTVGISTVLQRQEGKPTITKLRVLSQNQQLLRMDFEKPFDCVDSKALFKAFENILGQFDVLVISDYGKNSIADYQPYINRAKQANIPVLVDPKGTDFSKYRGATLLTPNYKEFEAVVGVCTTEAEIISKGLALLEQCDLEALLVTRGAKGMTLLRAGEPELHIPAKTREVYDVTGAGDTVIGIMASALAAGVELPMAMALANRAAGIVVGKIGAATVSLPELRRSIYKDEAIDRGVMTEEQPLIAIDDAKAHGEKIVMTNGCFDILHAGHVSYLENAKKLGDRLIIAVNDNDSVSRLKGLDRPINDIKRRQSVLAALASVDWVVEFSEDTPERIVGKLLPDVLVKGGDYQVEDIAGGDFVINNGGEVTVLNFEDGCSTTAMLDKIKQEILS